MAILIQSKINPYKTLYTTTSNTQLFVFSASINIITLLLHRFQYTLIRLTQHFYIQLDKNHLISIYKQGAFRRFPQSSEKLIWRAH